MRGHLTWGLLLLSPFAAIAAPPPDADPSLTPWYRALTNPQTHASCCGEADCRPTDVRIRDDHYEAFIDDKWLTVPPSKILTTSDNPTGRAVVCYSKSLGILCFVPSTGT